MDLDNGTRFFFVDADNEEFVWHKDKENRDIEVIEGNGWRLQFDNVLPILLYPGLKLTIDKMTYHRLIKGIDDLIIKMIKYD